MVRFLLLMSVLVFVGCTTKHYKNISYIVGWRKTLGLFEINVDNPEKQTFVIEKNEKPSFFLGNPPDGRSTWYATLCFDNVDPLEKFPWNLNDTVTVSMAMGGKNFIMDTVYKERAAIGYGKSIDINECWWTEKGDSSRQGWALTFKKFPPEIDFESPMVVEIQIREDQDSVLHKLAKRYSNPLLVIFVGK